MKTVIMGAGRMGQAIAWAMDRMGYDIVLVDNNPDNLFGAEHEFSKLTLVQSDGSGFSFTKGADVVISAMPYHQNLAAATYCVENHLKYCDLGGSVPVSSEINSTAKSYSNSTVMTDLGLAPGWVNIIAEHKARGMAEAPDTISMMVGGLPKKPNNYLKYNCTWSYDGLVNEYKDSCEILINGMQTIVSGMDGLVTVPTSIGDLEAFYTSGGASHTIDSMQKLGVKNCNYKTLRYQGHCEAVRFLINECNLDDDSLKRVFKRACPPAEDIVIVRVDVDGSVEEKVIETKGKFSAMQQATAFPISVVADIIAREEVSGILSYKDIPYEIFETNLDYLFREATDDESGS